MFIVPFQISRLGSLERITAYPRSTCKPISTNLPSAITTGEICFERSRSFSALAQFRKGQNTRNFTAQEVAAVGLILRRGSARDMNANQIKRIRKRSARRWLSIVCEILSHDLRYFRNQLKIISRSDKGKKSMRVSVRRGSFLRAPDNDN